MDILVKYTYYINCNARSFRKFLNLKIAYNTVEKEIQEGVHDEAGLHKFIKKYKTF